MIDDRVTADSGNVDVRGDEPPDRIDSRLLGTWWFGLASGAIRYYAIALCADGSAWLRTSFNGDGGPDPEGPFRGLIQPGPTPLGVVVRFDTFEDSPFVHMNVELRPETGCLVWAEEEEAFPGWASGCGVRDRFDLAPDDFTLGCD
jgi:hypothetical protein